MLPRVWEVWEKYLEVREKKERRESSGKAAKPGYSPTQTHTQYLFPVATLQYRHMAQRATQCDPDTPQQCILGNSLNGTMVFQCA